MKDRKDIRKEEGAGLPDANWWRFTTERGKRGGKIKNDAAGGLVEVNPDVGGRRRLSYHSYLRLDKLLFAQVPSSLTPDERIFIITHQLFELVFKQTIFDLRVIADTFSSLLSCDKKDFIRLSGIGEHQAKGSGGDDFWKPALTASGRIRHSCGKILPAFMTYLATEATFDNQEFGEGFRANLTPASGFQSAQIRLIQRAMGKSSLLDVRIFPADSYLREYLGMMEPHLEATRLDPDSAGLISVVDPLILREDAGIASPPADSPLFPVAGFDDLAHALMAMASAMDDAGDGDAGRVPMIPEDKDSLAAIERTFRDGLASILSKIKTTDNQPPELTAGEMAMIEKRAAVFGKDWAGAVLRENSRRARFGGACRGAERIGKAGTALTAIFENIADADDRLTGGFLQYHRDVVERRIGRVPGTAGGGIPFLDFSRRLQVKFPALIAFRAARPPSSP
jgi:tryptophan 2,3-dioxygenase